MTAPRHVCAMCDFTATAKCDYCSTLVCVAHFENGILYDEHDETGVIVRQTCTACIPEAQKETRENGTRVRAARDTEGRNKYLLELDYYITSPTTPFYVRAHARFRRFILNHGENLWGLAVLVMGAFLLYLMTSEPHRCAYLHPRLC